MKKLKLLFDLDGVIIDLHRVWLDKYNREYGDNLTQEEMFSSWGVEGNVKPEAAPHIYNMFDNPEDYADIPAVPGALEGFRQILSSPEDFDVYIVSAFSGKGSVADGKCRWLERHLPEFDRDRLVLTHAKEIVCGDVLVDDSVDNIDNWLAYQRRYNRYACGFLMDAPHNKLYDTNPWGPAVRVNNWEDILSHVYM